MTEANTTKANCRHLVHERPLEVVPTTLLTHVDLSGDPAVAIRTNVELRLCATCSEYLADFLKVLGGSPGAMAEVFGKFVR